MRRDDIRELHYMTAVANVPSIVRVGILSHEASEHIPHESIASEEVQARRATRTIPGGLRLHQYANLYFNARNSMLFRRLRDYDTTRRVPAEEIAILRVAADVLDRRGVVVTDINAAADEEPRWHTVEEGLALLDETTIYAQSWNHSDYWEKIRRMQQMMAEVLVPHRVEPEHLIGAYAVSDAAAAVLSGVAPTLEVVVQPYMFFQGPRP